VIGGAFYFGKKTGHPETNEQKFSSKEDVYGSLGYGHV
jgi:hypothetical protein